MVRLLQLVPKVALSDRVETWEGILDEVTSKEKSYSKVGINSAS